MKQFYNNSLQWKDKMNSIEDHYKEQLDDCKKEIEEVIIIYNTWFFEKYWYIPKVQNNLL